jgi:hypothetical protein
VGNRLGVVPAVLAATIFTAGTALADAGDARDFLSKSPDIFQHLIDFIVTINMGAFAAIGYLVKDTKLTSTCARTAQLIFASLAFLCCAISLYFAYGSYTFLMAMTGNNAFAYDRLADYPYAALFLILSAPFIFLTLIVTTVKKAP